MEELQKEIDFLYGLERFGMIFGLENVSALLELLGNPHLKLRAIHVAGTNGKGSVCAILDSILSRRYKVGLYTSPHLHRLNERIKINGKEIGDEELLNLIRLLREKTEKAKRPERFTFFDFTTALAFFYFLKKEVDLAIVEVGLGGRLDSTNVIRPLVGVITNIGHDHMDVLGPTLRDIAREKAGIIKENTPIVCGEKKEEPLQVILEEASKKKAPLYLLGRDFHYQYEDGLFSFFGRRLKLQGLRLGLLGRHQVENASLALEVIETLLELGFPVEEEHIRKGLEEARWPGRLELVESKPKVLMDGAHNPEGMRVLCEFLKEISFKKLHVIIGIMKDKSWKEMLQILLPFSQRVIAFRPQNPRSLEPETIIKVAKQMGIEGVEAKTPEEALRIAKEKADPEDLILITGSLFTVGEIRELLLKGL
jgi:dihydrofolate synthase/folylpolyglutamate synthase